MTRPRLLDLFCGAGGAAMGYHRAGFDVVGVDINPQPRYPFAFVQGDALEYVAEHGREFDVIHASPPCQGYSRMRHLPWLREREYPLLIPPTRALLQASGQPFVIENVEDARPHLHMPIRLCGLSFGLRMYRHRLFEASCFMLEPGHQRHQEVIFRGRLLNRRYSQQGMGIMGILPDPAGHTAGVSTRRAAEVMGVEWMRRDDMNQAIPPAYTEWIGAQLLRQMGATPQAMAL